MIAAAADDRLLVSRTTSLAPDLASASMARKVLRTALAEAGCERWTDSAEFALGEVVANAVLHAHTPMQLTLEIRTTGVHVEVRDANPTLPIPRDYDAEATTGRGMALVAALTSDCGVRALGAGGKVVWFDVNDTAASEQSEQDLLDAWDFPEDADPSDDTSVHEADASANVTLVGLPSLLWLAARQHHDALTRELVLHAVENDVPGIDVAAADRARSTVSEALAVRLEQLRPTSSTTEHGGSFSFRGPQPWIPPCVDLELRVAPALSRDFPVMQDTLDAAERLAAAGRLLTLPGLPEIVEVRDWVCSQVVAQLAGVSPSPWPGSALARFETMTTQRRGDEASWDASVVTESAVGVVAADDSNRIVAVSRPLADALGWAVDDLVGRRVVTLIPPALRELHIAAFTRYLTTGEANVLDRLRLQLPVLRKDGTEVLSNFFLERAPDARGRAVFLAWIEPLADAAAAG